MNIFRALQFLLLLCCSGGLFAANEAPQRLRLIWSQAPATEATIAWDGAPGSLHYGLRGQALDQEAAVSHSNTAMEMQNQFVRLKGLQPDQAYDCEIRTDSGNSKRYWFRTAPDQAQPLTFVAGGDSRNNHQARRHANLIVSHLQPLFVAFGGDMTASDTPEQWQQWFDDWQLTVSPSGRLIPIVAARGNHERRNSSIAELFDSPHPDVYFAMSIGGSYLRLYTLNSEIFPDREQGAWLADDLNSHQAATWKVAQYHRPLRPHVAGKAERLQQYHAWAGLFHQYGMSLVVECDAHCVKTTWPLRPSTGEGSSEGFIRDDETGTVFIGEGCWGAPIRPANDRKPWTRDADSFNHISWIQVYPDRMDIRTVPSDQAPQLTGDIDEDPFSVPKHLTFWEPANGAVVSVKPQVREAIDASSLPFDPKLPMVELLCDKTMFSDQTTITLRSSAPDLPIHYSLGEADPGPDSPRYAAPIVVEESAVIKAALVNAAGQRGPIASIAVEKIPAAAGERTHEPSVFLGDLEWIEQSAGWSETKRNRHISGKVLLLQQREWQRGLGMHSVGHVLYACQPSWQRFVATAGLDDRVKGNAIAGLRVLADGVELYRNPVPLIKYQVVHIDVAIPAGTRQIRIEALDGGNGADWDNLDLVEAGFVVAP